MKKILLIALMMPRLVFSQKAKNVVIGNAENGSILYDRPINNPAYSVGILNTEYIVCYAVDSSEDDEMFFKIIKKQNRGLF